VFSPDPPCTPTTSIRSDRSADQSPITGTPVGATNLGSDTSGNSDGVSADYATVSGGDRNMAAADYATASGGVFALALAEFATAGGGDAAIAAGIGSAATGVDAFAFGGAAVALGLTAQATGIDSLAVGPNKAGDGVFSFTVAAGGTTVTIPGDVTDFFNNGDPLAIVPATPKFLASVLSLTVASVPAFGGVDTTFDLSAPIDGTTTAGFIADTLDGNGAAAVAGSGNQAQGTNSFIGGGDSNRITPPASSARAGGALALASRVTQDAWASGSDGVAAGNIQTSKLVLNGTTPGSGVGETVELAIDSTLPFELEDDKGYVLTLSAIALGFIGGVRKTQSFEVEVTAHREGGTTAISAANTITQQGDAAAATWDIAATVGAAPDRLVFTFSTGATTAQTVVGGELRWTEVLLSNPS
jgi:hypothetical protein